jgi:hypothetical protein
VAFLKESGPWGAREVDQDGHRPATVADAYGLRPLPPQIGARSPLTASGEPHPLRSSTVVSGRVRLARAGPDRVFDTDASCRRASD